MHDYKKTDYKGKVSNWGIGGKKCASVKLCLFSLYKKKKKRQQRFHVKPLKVSSKALLGSAGKVHGVSEQYTGILGIYLFCKDRFNQDGGMLPH